MKVFDLLKCYINHKINILFADAVLCGFAVLIGKGQFLNVGTQLTSSEKYYFFISHFQIQLNALHQNIVL